MRTDTMTESPKPFAATGIDPLSDVLRAVRLTGAVFFLTDARAPWVVSMPAASSLTEAVMPRAQHLISYHVVTTGCCWFAMPGAIPVALEAGDVVVIPHGDPYTMSSAAGIRDEAPAGAAVEFLRMMAARQLPFVSREGGDSPEPLRLLCGFLGCDVIPFNPVLATLPRVLHVHAADRIGHLVDFAMRESAERQAGSDSILIRISELLFVEVVRQYLAALPPGQNGWLAALRDEVAGRALTLLHEQPARAWTLELLARESGASRSTLAERFTTLVGQAPMQYLAQWRMQIAARLLEDSNAKVATVGLQVGYESEAAFSRAFRKLVGMPPAAWRKRKVSALRATPP
jgi:AraC-like DNA-binding protein